MRARPEMQPWVNTDKSGLSSVGAARTAQASEFIGSGVSPLQGSSTFLVVLMSCSVWVLGISDFIGIFALILGLFI